MEEKTVKRCRYCEQEKTVDLFYKHAKNKDKIDSYCKACRAEMKKPKHLRTPRGTVDYKPSDDFNFRHKPKYWKTMNTWNKYDAEELDYYLYNDLDITKAFYEDSIERLKSKRKLKKKW